MAEIYKFFNSAPGDERWYYASDFAEYFGDVLSSGLLYEEDGTNLQVRVVTGTLKTIVEPGKALIKGYRYWNTSPLELAHSIPEIDTDRIDRIVLRMDIRNNARSIRAFVKEGVSAAEPVPPELQRDNYVYELSLAQVRVTKNTASIVPENLIDERMYEELCGIVHSMITVPTEVFQQQWDDWFDLKKVVLGDDMEDWMEDQQQAFTDWFATIQDILDGDVAANLAAQIGQTNNNLTLLDNKVTSHMAQTGDIANLQTNDKTNLVAAINEVFQTGNNVKSDTVDALLSLDSNLPITHNSLWADIIQEIGNISVGKKSASGTGLVDTTTWILTVSGLDFKPSIIIVGPNNQYTYGYGFSVYIKTLGNYPNLTQYYAGSEWINVNGQSGQYITLKTSGVTLQDDGFIMGSLNYQTGREFFWIAME